ncbi:XrtA/PEP-CTERM system exopolysaccharide export protein [Luteimonas arsenica]|uniref:XrtA/PEP-CTERM system exopolysaccharide export protein n=1 Tax=Luteimonas arsenica TaxID=1586242 RepID=UPI00105651AA|nr:XrtA/PEP-CTERM system exopolysaccharide export protein [Luteimonas arsenica]
MNRLHRLLCGLSLTCLLAACATPGYDTTVAPLPPETTNVDSYRLGVDDIVQVSVWGHPDAGVTAPIRPDGMISVPLLGDVAAGGRTPPEVAQDIQTRLQEYVKDARVSVILTELHSHEYLSRVRVTGAVRQPVSIPYRAGMTVLDAVLAAGGVTEFAAPNRSSLHRKTGSGTGSYSVQLDNVLNGGDLTTNYPVAPGDVITVPERIL